MSARVASHQRISKEFKIISRQAGTADLPYVHDPEILGNSLDRWRVKLRDFDDSLPGGQQLNKDLERLSQQYGQDHIVLEISFPGDYPHQPPFMRVVSPRCKMYTGHVTAGGSICLEALTNSGTSGSWQPTLALETLLHIIVFNMIDCPTVYIQTPTGPGGLSGPLRVDFDRGNPLTEYSASEAQAAFTRTLNNHLRTGWGGGAASPTPPPRRQPRYPTLHHNPTLSNNYAPLHNPPPTTTYPPVHIHAPTTYPPLPIKRNLQSPFGPSPSPSNPTTTPTLPLSALPLVSPPPGLVPTTTTNTTTTGAGPSTSSGPPPQYPPLSPFPQFPLTSPPPTLFGPPSNLASLSLLPISSHPPTAIPHPLSIPPLLIPSPFLPYSLNRPPNASPPSSSTAPPPLQSPTYNPSTSPPPSPPNTRTPSPPLPSSPPSSPPPRPLVIDLTQPTPPASTPPSDPSQSPPPPLPLPYLAPLPTSSPTPSPSTTPPPAAPPAAPPPVLPAGHSPRRVRQRGAAGARSAGGAAADGGGAGAGTLGPGAGGQGHGASSSVLGQSSSPLCLVSSDSDTDSDSGSNGSSLLLLQQRRQQQYAQQQRMQILQQQQQLLQQQRHVQQQQQQHQQLLVAVQQQRQQQQQFAAIQQLQQRARQQQQFAAMHQPAPFQQPQQQQPAPMLQAQSLPLQPPQQQQHQQQQPQGPLQPRQQPLQQQAPQQQQPPAGAPRVVVNVTVQYPDYWDHTQLPGHSEGPALIDLPLPPSTAQHSRLAAMSLVELAADLLGVASRPVQDLMVQGVPREDALAAVMLGGGGGGDGDGDGEEVGGALVVFASDSLGGPAAVLQQWLQASGLEAVLQGLKEPPQGPPQHSQMEAEAAEVIRHLEAGGLSRQQVVGLQRVQHPRLWQAFFLCCQRVGEDAGDTGCNEQWLFHGASRDAVEAILREGFDTRLASTNCAYGMGTYFSDKATCALEYCRKQGHPATLHPGPSFPPPGLLSSPFVHHPLSSPFTPPIPYMPQSGRRQPPLLPAPASHPSHPSNPPNPPQAPPMSYNQVQALVQPGGGAGSGFGGGAGAGGGSNNAAAGSSSGAGAAAGAWGQVVSPFAGPPTGAGTAVLLPHGSGPSGSAGGGSGGGGGGSGGGSGKWVGGEFVGGLLPLALSEHVDQSQEARLWERLYLAAAKGVPQPVAAGGGGWGTGGGVGLQQLGKMIVSRVALGRWQTRGGIGMRRPPPGYQSVCGSIGQAQVHVVFDNHQAYPEYVVTLSA